MRTRRAATYLVDPATGEERLVENGGGADLPAPESDRPVGKISPADVTGGPGAPIAEEDEA